MKTTSEIHTLAKQLAPLLRGTYFDPRTRPHWQHAGWAEVHIVRNGVLTGILQIGSREGGKLSIRGGWPTYNRPGAGEVQPSSHVAEEAALTVSIGVAESKTPQRIASDITSRLLPDYTKAYAICVARRDAEEAYTAKRGTALDELFAITGGRKNSNTASNTYSLPFSTYNGYGTVLTSDSTARIEIHSLPLEKAKKLLALYADLTKPTTLAA